MNSDTKPALREPRLWYDSEMRSVSLMVPLRPTYEPLWNITDMQAYGKACEDAANRWRNTVDDMLVTYHMVASDDPRESINRLIDWNVQVALDPAVSSDAQALVDAAIERCAKVCEEVEASAWALWKMGADPIEQGRNIGAQHCADAMRALKGQPT